MNDPRTRLTEIGAVVRDRFESQKRVLSFDEYLALVGQQPWRYTRDAARYLRDCLDHFGTYDVMSAGRSVRRWRLFDLEFTRADADRVENRNGHDFLVGQERLQADFYRILGNFVREGQVNRLVLLHGPNGSAKSTFVGCLMRALEHYSNEDAGALYRFSWIFPRGKDGKTVGFGSRDDSLPVGESYAHLPDERIDVKLTSELRENPLLLLPVFERVRLLRELYASSDIESPLPRSLSRGDLGFKNKQIFEALLTAYRGDLAKVLNHVRVERFYHSRRYRVGVVTIGPEMAVDAQERQISVDRSLGALPASLSALSLYETVGELVDASGGMLEYSDLLKRPLDAWRYLLLSIETGEVSLTHSQLPLNSVLVATSNELHLKAFREHHEYRSFRGRLQPVRVPYLVDFRREQGIYDAQIIPQVRVHVAPHSTYVAALWAVLTRLRRPQREHYERDALGELAASLTPMEKAHLYADGTMPERLTPEEAKELRAGIEEVRAETDTWPNYEGLSGASPREIRTLLLDAAQHPGYACLSPLAVLDHIAQFCESGDFDFLKEKVEDGYHDHRGFVERVRERWVDLLDEEFRTSTGLVEETQYHELFDRYVMQVSYWTKGERIENRVTGKFEEADPKFLESVEDMLDAARDGRETFRQNLISAVAGHAIDNPDTKVDYAKIFPRHLAKLREASYQKLRRELANIGRDVLDVLSEDAAVITRMGAPREAKARETLAALFDRYGYAAPSAKDAVGQLLETRYADREGEA
ncbi:MAG: serine protein kinase PrkA [Sandaracinaceae bacterium]|nr:serine protein kinase PrkA [Sandaracinaceae bacterium]